MDKIKFWLYQYHNEITWFLTGFLVCSGIDALAQEQYLTSLLSFFLAYLNCKINTR